VGQLLPPLRDALDVYPPRVVLLRIPPDTHEVECGWIGGALRSAM